MVEALYLRTACSGADDFGIGCLSAVRSCQAQFGSGPADTDGMNWSPVANP